MTYEATTLLPEEKILQQAHTVAIMKVRHTISFFILAWIFNYFFGFIFGFVIGSIIPLLAFAASLIYCTFLGNVLEYGEMDAGLELYKGKNICISNLFVGMNDYFHVMSGMFWFKLRRGLWGLVPIIGTMKYYSYCFTPYILKAYPNLTPEEALQMSVRLTSGRKMELFVRDLKFTGWRILNTVSAGVVGIVYFFAFYNATWAGYYLEAETAADARRSRTTTRREEWVYTDTSTPSLSSNSFRRPNRL